MIEWTGLLKPKNWSLKNMEEKNIQRKNQLMLLNKMLWQMLKTYIMKAIPLFIAFFILSSIYLWSWGRYGFERTLIVLLVSILVVVNEKK
jgi:hypothetical protein